VPAGSHRLSVQLNDSVREPGFNYTRDEDLDIRPGQIVVVDFNPEKGGIVVQ
jgi:primosomal protein N'